MSDDLSDDPERRFYEILKKDRELYEQGRFTERFDAEWKKELYADFEPPNPANWNWSWAEDGEDDDN